MIIKTVTTDNSAILPIGRQGEHDARRVWFDLSYLIENFGEGTAVLVHQRSMDEAPYICQAEQDGETLIWNIDETDTAYEGFGKAEIRWTVDDALAKTVIYRTNVMKSLTGDTQIPTPLQSWYDAMIEYLNAGIVTDVQVTTLPAGSSATAEYDNGTLSLGIPRGDQGIQGIQGQQGIQGETGNGIASIIKTGTSGNVDTYTITMTNGTTTTFTVTNGAVTSVDGQTGAVQMTATGDGTVALGFGGGN